MRRVEFVLASPDLFEISLILKAACQRLQYNQILYRQNRYLQRAKRHQASSYKRRPKIYSESAKMKSTTTS